MSVRVVARIRPVNSQTELDKDVILSTANGPDGNPSIVSIPNPKNLSEEFSFQFNNVYGADATQQQIFDGEVAPTVKHLFSGFDVTIFAYGSTGTGKTHTMRGGKTLVDRGMIPRLLSSIYRKSRALEKNTEGQTTIDVSMSYYEIYNDRVFDLFEAPEKRNATGLPIREAEGGKTVVVGLTEEPCNTLKDFEVLYDMANANRSVGATKLNAHSSRSHAILGVKLTISTPTETKVSNVSCIDLAGSEDNRRTGNGKDRMVESASINKSLFVLAQCVEAISKKQPRIPYRESKMTRILSLGQNNGFTVMILNLAPIKSFHLDTLSSLNFANRTKKIEVREVENEPIFKGPPRPQPVAGPNIQRQPLRPIAERININLGARYDTGKSDKPPKAFSVYSDRNKGSSLPVKPKSPAKPLAELPLSVRPSKVSRPTPSFLRRGPEPQPAMSKATIESLVEAKVSEILATRALAAPEPAPAKQISEEVQRRLDSIEKRLEGQDGERAEGLSYLFMAKQHQARGEDISALKMYELAKPYFPGNEKLEGKIERLKERITRKRDEQMEAPKTAEQPRQVHKRQRQRDESEDNDNDESYHASGEELEDDEEERRPRERKVSKPKRRRASSPDPLVEGDAAITPRTQHLIDVINTRDVVQIRTLAGVGAKRAEGIIDFMNGHGEDGPMGDLRSWRDLSKLKGVGKKTLEVMREGVAI